MATGTEPGSAASADPDPRPAQARRGARPGPAAASRGAPGGSGRCRSPGPDRRASTELRPIPPGEDAEGAVPLGRRHPHPAALRIAATPRCFSTAALAASRCGSGPSRRWTARRPRAIWCLRCAPGPMKPGRRCAALRCSAGRPRTRRRQRRDRPRTVSARSSWRSARSIRSSAWASVCRAESRGVGAVWWPTRATPTARRGRVGRCAGRRTSASSRRRRQPVARAPATSSTTRRARGGRTRAMRRSCRT